MYLMYKNMYIVMKQSIYFYKCSSMNEKFIFACMDALEDKIETVSIVC